MYEKNNVFNRNCYATTSTTTTTSFSKGSGSNNVPSMSVSDTLPTTTIPIATARSTTMINSTLNINGDENNCDDSGGGGVGGGGGSGGIGVINAAYCYDDDIDGINNYRKMLLTPSTSSSSLPPSATTTNETIPWRFWLIKAHTKLYEIPWHSLRHVKWMNKRAHARTAYVPTEVEHLANIVTHGIWVVPAMYAAIQLLWRSHSSSQFVVAMVYGISLSLLFIISTIFHSVFYCNRNRQLKDILHRCDRAMIYIFIAGSYFPWLSLSSAIDSNLMLFCLKWSIWLLAAFGILYQQMYHERYKCLETFLYIVMGLGPSIVIVICGHEFNGMAELKLGGLIYLVGICFFKADGSIPCAHAIWHLFVVIAASFHYYAILCYLFPTNVSQLTDSIIVSGSNGGGGGVGSSLNLI